MAIDQLCKLRQFPHFLGWVLGSEEIMEGKMLDELFSYVWLTVGVSNILHTHE